MQSYDFLNLSSVEFEDLARDILQKHLNIYLESFTEGKDGGIDLRGSIDKNKTLLIQCKRYKDFNSLKGNLIKESSKVKVLKPEKYILVTSVGLTPKNKAEIKKIFEPYILSCEDIFGKDDLNNLLGQYSEIEEKYYKLWLSSTSVLKTILQSNIKNRSEFLEDSIKNSIKLFVQNKSVNEAIDILNDVNFTIISGNPGVGKTTLAKMLILHYMSKEFELIEISEDIEEGNKLFAEDKKQIFYYDDFLGSNFLERSISKNEDKRLYHFMERVKANKNKKLIMTTREYILKQAQQKYEVLGRTDIDLAKHILDLESYTRVAKAEIFYNHLFFSNLSEDYIKAVVHDKGYYKIINHPNYNPRVIELMTIRLNKKIITPNKYLEHFLNSLTNPSEIWRSAFENQISELSKYLLYSVLISHIAIKEEKLIRSVKEMINYDSQRFNLSLKRGDFLNSLKELENTFIEISKETDNGNYIEFQNPSVNDFLIHYIENDNDLIEMIINSMVFFNQLFTIFNPYDKTVNPFYPRILNLTHKIELKSQLKETLEKKIIRDFDNMEITEGKYEYHTNDKIMYLNQFYDYTSEGLNYFLAKKIQEVNIKLLADEEQEEFVTVIKKLKKYLRLNINDLILSYIESISSLNGIRGLIKLANIYPEEYQLFIDYNREILMEIIEEVIYANIDSADNNENNLIGLKSAIEEVGIFFNEEFKSAFDFLDEKLENVKYDDDDDDDYRLSKRQEENFSKKAENLKIDRMFDSLLN